MTVDAPVVNVANAVTLGRILCTPPLLFLMLATEEGSLVVAACFAVLALSDALDGYLARSRQLITNVGKLLDPVADKLLIGSALIALVHTARLAAVVAMVILLREVLVSWLRYAAYRQGFVIPAGQLGKAKMALQVALVLVLLANGDPHAAWVQVLVVATVVMTIASGMAYLAALPRLVGSRA